MKAAELLNRPRNALAARDERRLSALQARLAAVAAALELPCSHTAGISELSSALAHQLRSDQPDVIWLVLAAVNGILPTPEQVRAAARGCDFDGASATLGHILAGARADGSRLRGEWAPVRIVVGAVLVDLHHTSRTLLATGIQRVARQSVRRWNDEHDITLVGWSAGFTHLTPLDAERSEVALHGVATGAPTNAAEVAPVIIPWRSTYLLPELMTERVRALRLQALFSYSHCRTGAIGFDCVPITSAETTADTMGGAFSINLTAIARMDRVATISSAAAMEYRGWRAMLVGAGLLGPEIAAIDLATEACTALPETVSAFREQYCIGALPTVLVVGSHEPRKNHVAVLHAAELLWREGLRFSLTFVGGNAWKSDRFTNRLAELQGVGRPVQSVSALSDEMLWAAYEVATFTVFPSLNEGFGLPVAESLATGTPVITADFGSMREIAASGGALLIDPRSDRAIAEAMRILLSDAETHARLTAQAQLVATKSWDTYAFEVWHHLVDNEDQPATSATLENGTS